MEKLIGKTAAVVIAVIIVLFSVFQIVRFMRSPYRTEIVYNYSVQDSIHAQGIMIRDEVLVEDSVDGVPGYYYGDGSRVSKGDNIIKVHPDMQSVENERKYLDIEKQIESLKDIQNYAGTNALKADSLDRYINELISSLSLSTSSTIYTDTQKTQEKILKELNKKQIISGTQSDFVKRIDELEQIQSSLSFADESNVITAPETGYFVSTTDGFEGLVNSSSIDSLTDEKLKQLIDTPIVESDDNAGKIITSNDWHFAVSIEPEHASKFAVGAAVTLDFGITSFKEVPATVEKVISPSTDKENTVVVFSGNYMSSQLANMRVKSAEINFKSYSGLKVSENAIHYTNNETWVYIISGLQITKVPVNIIYQGVGYVICSSVKDETNGLSLFDEVVVEGSDLYDGKTVR